MLVKNINPDVDRLSHAEGIFESLGQGIFDLPEAVGQELVKFPEWVAHFGERPATPAPSAPAPEPAPAPAEEAAPAVPLDEAPAMPSQSRVQE